MGHLVIVRALRQLQDTLAVKVGLLRLAITSHGSPRNDRPELPLHHKLHIHHRIHLQRMARVIRDSWEIKRVASVAQRGYGSFHRLATTNIDVSVRVGRVALGIGGDHGSG